MTMPGVWRIGKVGKLGYWDEVYSMYGSQYPDNTFWQFLKTTYPEGVGDIARGYVNATLRDLFDRYKTGAISQKPTGSAIPTDASGGQGTPGTSRIVNNYQGTGYDVALQYDMNGNPIITDVLGKSAKSEDITPYQQAQLDLATSKWQAEDYATRQQQVLDADRNRQIQVANQYQKYAVQRAAGGARSEEDIRTSGLAQTYEEWRNRLLGELTDPRDWITKWQVQNRPNPYTPREVSTIESLQTNAKSSQTEEQNAKAALADWTKRATDNTEMIDPQILATAANRYNTAVEQRNRWQGELESYTSSPEYQQASQPRETGIGGNKVISGTPEMPQKPSGIPVPAWLPKFVPQLAGKSEFAPTEKYQVPTPSGQMWQATPTSVKQGLAGYMDWAGQDYRDTLDYMKMMLPNNPSRAPTAWTPRR